MEITSLCETNETTLVLAHKAGIAYEKRNRPSVPIADLAFVARASGWHGDLCRAWLAGAAGERRRNDPEPGLDGERGSMDWSV
jgi:hypothetical protein